MLKKFPVFLPERKHILLLIILLLIILLLIILLLIILLLIILFIRSSQLSVHFIIVSFPSLQRCASVFVYVPSCGLRNTKLHRNYLLTNTFSL